MKTFKRVLLYAAAVDVVILAVMAISVCLDKGPTPEQIFTMF